jgi:hypothetical protein
MPSLMGTSHKHSYEKDNEKEKHTSRKSYTKIHSQASLSSSNGPINV